MKQVCHWVLINYLTAQELSGGFASDSHISQDAIYSSALDFYGMKTSLRGMFTSLHLHRKQTQRRGGATEAGGLCSEPQDPPGEKVVWLLGSELFGCSVIASFQSEVSFPAAQGNGSFG